MMMKTFMTAAALILSVSLFVGCDRVEADFSNIQDTKTFVDESGVTWVAIPANEHVGGHHESNRVPGLYFIHPAGKPIDGHESE